MPRARMRRPRRRDESHRGGRRRSDPFGIVFAMNSAEHSSPILSYAENDRVAMSAGFYDMANAIGRLAGTILSGLLYQWHGLTACLWASAGFALAAGLVSIALPAAPPQGAAVAAARPGRLRETPGRSAPRAARAAVTLRRQRAPPRPCIRPRLRRRRPRSACIRRGRCARHDAVAPRPRGHATAPQSPCIARPGAGLHPRPRGRLRGAGPRRLGRAIPIPRGR